MLVFSQSSWVSSALTDSSPSPLVLSLLTTSHLLAPAGSITISLGWLLLLLLAPWWNWKGWFSSSSCVCPLGRSWMLGHQLGCCRDFVEPETSPPSHPPPLHPIFLLLISFSLEWCHRLRKSDCHCQGDCVYCEPYWWHTKQGQRATVSQHLINETTELWSELAGKIHVFYVTT